VLDPAKQSLGIRPCSDVLELANFVKTVSRGSYFMLASGAPRQAYTSNYFTRNSRKFRATCLGSWVSSNPWIPTATALIVTVTEALVLRPLLEDRGRVRVNPYLGARRQNETKMFSDHDETSPSIAAVSVPSVACSMLAVQQQKRLCRQFVDVSAARRGCHTMKCAV